MAKSSTHACSSCMKLGRLRKKNSEERQTWAMVSHNELLSWAQN